LKAIRFWHQQVVQNVSTSRRVPRPRGSPNPGEGAGQHPREFARAFRRPETFGVPYYLIQFLEQLNLLINQQLRITDHIDWQNVSDLEREIRLSFGERVLEAHLTICFTWWTNHIQSPLALLFPLIVSTGIWERSFAF
jgi:hypothetical protein